MTRKTRLIFLILSILNNNFAWSWNSTTSVGVPATKVNLTKLNLSQILKSANKGVPTAQANLGACYLYGYGVKKDFNLAYSWLIKAANQNLPIAQFNIGIMYLNGYGIPLNYNNAATWFYKAAAKGIPEAQLNLGILYATGKGVKQNKQLAEYWFNRASKLGDAKIKNCASQALTILHKHH